MKNRIMGMGLAGLMLAGGIVAGAAVPASATYGGETCTPSDAWVEVVEVPAIGEPKITVTNPDYKPAVPAVTDIVKHPAETKVVEHAAEGYTEYHFAKFTRERTRTFSIYGWSAWTDYGAWSKYSPETHTSWQQNTNPIGSPQWHSSGDRNWGTVQWERQWQAQYDGQSRWHETKAAWSETVETKPAWEETVIITPEIPAVGTETIEVDNPDYVPATTRNIEHDAVTCPTAPPTTPVTPEKPAPAPVKAAVTAPKADALATTGADPMGTLWGLTGAALLLASGAGLTVLGARRHQIKANNK